MNEFGIAFALINGILLLTLPRRWAPLPLIVGSCYMTMSQGIKIGVFNFPILRLLIAAGVLRVVIKGERLGKRINELDWLMFAWSFAAILSSVFHEDPVAAIIFRLGLVYNACGVYFLIRIFCQSIEDVLLLVRIIGILLSPLAIEMAIEKITHHNIFSLLGGVSDIPSIREGKLRAQGPFAHSILAGTVGAVCLPLMIGLWKHHLKSALMGILACLIIIFTCASSGPYFSSFAGIMALFMWRFRYKMRHIQWLFLLGYVGLELVMEAPAYYLIARVDAVGGSTGYHRARLIDAAIEHISEWWLAGTDYTRHWMVTGVEWSPDHADITNHYIYSGVIGGLPLVILFILILVRGFFLTGRILREFTKETPETQFLIWALGSSLFVHAATCISVSYFDQSFIFIYMNLAVITSIWSSVNLDKAAVTVEGNKKQRLSD